MDTTQKHFTNKTIHIKLDDSNFLQWKQQVSFTVSSHKLDTYLDGSAAVDQYIVHADGTKVPNPAYDSFKQQDSALASWLLSSVSDHLLPSLVKCTNSADIWRTLHNLFSVTSQTRVMRLLCSLQSQRKRGVTMRDYLSIIQMICDSLRSSDHSVTETMQISTILAGLTNDYEHIVAVITASKQPYDLAGVTSVLLDAESRLNDTMLDTTISPVAFTASSVESNASTFGPSSVSVGTNSAPRMFGVSASSFDPRAGGVHHVPGYDFPSVGTSRPRPPLYYGRGRGRGSSGSTRHQCQLCGKLGHLVNRCWFRFDPNFPGPGPDSFSRPRSPHPQVSPSAQFADHYSGYDYHQSVDSGLLRTPVELSPFQPASAASSHTANAAWYPDSGASTHMTMSPSNLTTSAPYTGMDHISVGNGNSVPITHTGSSVASSFYSPVRLNNILLAPQLTKNLLSVSQFVKDNHAYFVFYPTGCFAKDLSTNRVLLEGVEVDGLYTLHLQSHPSSATLPTVSESVSIPVTSSTTVNPIASSVSLSRVCATSMESPTLSCSVML